MADEFKALTLVNLPFIEKRYDPGRMIPRSDFEKNAEIGIALVDDRTAKDPDASVPMTADEQIDYFMEWGTISDDPDAPLHPSSIIPNPGDPTMGRLVAQAQMFVKMLEERGVDVPAKLRGLAEVSDRQITMVDSGRTMDDGHVSGE